MPEPLAARYNVAPTQQVLTVCQDPVGRNASYLKWAFIQSWSKAGKIATINALCETAADKPMFQTAMRKRPCLLPADGFFEWAKQGKTKQPVHFRLRSGDPFAFAGIWDTWRHGDEAIETAALPTT